MATKTYKESLSSNCQQKYIHLNIFHSTQGQFFLVHPKLDSIYLRLQKKAIIGALMQCTHIMYIVTFHYLAVNRELVLPKLVNALAGGMCTNHRSKEPASVVTTYCNSAGPDSICYKCLEYPASKRYFPLTRMRQESTIGCVI